MPLAKSWKVAAGFVPVGDKVVLIGQMIAAGTATALTPVQIFDKNTPKTLFGANSMAYLMSRAFITANDKAEVWVLPVEDSGTGVATEMTITIEVTTALAGTLSVYLGNEKISIFVSADDVDSAIATALAAAITANKEQPFTASAAAAVVTVACASKGTSGNYVRIEVTEEPGGVTATVASSVAGANDPDISEASGVLDTLFPTDFTISVSPYSDATSLGHFKTHLDDVSDGDEMRGQGMVFGYTDKVGNQAAFQSLTSTHNHWRSLGFYFPGIRSIYYEVAAACAATMCKQPRPGDTIDDYPVTGIDIPEVADRLSETQKNAVLLNGGSPLHVIDNKAAIVMARSCYVSNAGGGYVDKLTDMITYRSLDWLRIQVNNMEANQYKNKKNSAQTRENLEDSIFTILKKAESSEFEITQNVDVNRDAIVAIPDSSVSGRANVTMPADIVPGLHQIENTIRLL